MHFRARRWHTCRDTPQKTSMFLREIFGHFNNNNGFWGYNAQIFMLFYQFCTFFVFDYVKLESTSELIVRVRCVQKKAYKCTKNHVIQCWKMMAVMFCARSEEQKMLYLQPGTQQKMAHNKKDVLNICKVLFLFLDLSGNECTNQKCCEIIFGTIFVPMPMKMPRFWYVVFCMVFIITKP